MAVEVLSVAQVGEILGCKRSKVYELISDGVLERAPKFGREPRIFRSSVDRALLGSSRGETRKRRVQGPPEVRLEDIPI